MGAHSNGRRTLAGFFGLAFGVVLLFWLVALVALQPQEGLAWVQVPDLTADLRLDAGLQTQPLKKDVIAEVLRDQQLDGASAGTLAVAPALTAAQPPAALALAPSSSARPVSTAQPVLAPTGSPQPVPTPAPASQPTATPTPTASATSTATPTPTPTPRPSPTPVPTPTPTPRPTPTPTPTPTPRFAVTSANESVSRRGNSGNQRCSSSTVTASGSFTTNGVGGTVYYGWLRTDNQGNRQFIPESPIRIAAGDTSSHAVVSDIFTPAHSGSDELVFISPFYTAAPQSWSCVG